MSGASFVQRIKLRTQRLWLSGWLPISGWAPNAALKKGERILIYHGVAPKVLPGLNSRFIDLQRFREEMTLLKKHYQVVSLSQLSSGEYDRTRLAVALSFDDGYANNLRHAMPVLAQLGLPATFFVTAIRGLGRDILWPDLLNLTAYQGTEKVEVMGEVFLREGAGGFRSSSGIGLMQRAWRHPDPAFIVSVEQSLEEMSHFKRKTEWSDYWEQLTEEELRQIAGEHRFDIGSHGARHYNLAAIPAATAESDLTFSKQWLERITGKPVPRLAYPGGSRNPELHEIALSLGYEHLYVEDYANASECADPQLHDRLGVHPKVGALVQMYYLQKGYY